MDRADLGLGPGGTHQRDNPIDVFRRQRPGILAIVNGEVGDPVWLVGGDPRAGDSGKDLLG
jgi:hypothetical protein